MSPETLGRQFEGVPLYHGTVHPFQIGDVIHPSENDVAYATPHIEVAQSRARDHISYSWEDNKKLNPTWNTPGGKQFDEYAKENPPRVFRVEPIGPTQTHEHGHVTSRQGFRVIGEVINGEK